MNYKVKVDNVSKVYDLNRSKISKIISLFTFGQVYKIKPFYALKNINFEVQPGDSVGILGLNGSGKSTLSDLLGEVTQPTDGKIDINGKSSLIAVNAGLNQELTGYENIRMKCLMHGLTENEINNKFKDIVAFSELGEFLEQPIKNYSSGMKSKLGFAIAIHTDPDILIVDEALSVGDETFADKCFMKMKEFQGQGKTIFFVSHATGQVKKWCNKAVWIQYGEMKEFGDSHTVINNYSEFISKYKSLTKAEQLEYKEKMHDQQKLNKRSSLNQPKEDFSKSGLTFGLLFLLLFLAGILGQVMTLQ
ncbi:ABC transporter ATP-binding protein [Corticicoccus populi]|uniref:ABC transporter ATP-binding protein n=1 Tax=Corticicoccus populi TaxID=1812821 RepID=A0ABW5WU20_9STAP